MVSNNNKARVHALALVAAMAAAMATLSACGGGKGNCTSCHPSVHQEFTSRALFTDFSYDNIGIPRNWNIPANASNPANPFAQEIDDLVAFLCTLTDGFDSNNPSAYNVPVQCQPKESVP
jgi:cytochrome c peroxidase